MKKIILQKKIKQKKSIIDIIGINQTSCINKLFLDEEFAEKKELMRRLKRKLSSYRTQDIKKKRYNQELFITISALIEKLVISKLKCFYCKCDIMIFYNNVREPKQWTLDRINNNLPHNTDNVVIACLECNLKRRCQDDKKFLFTKQMKIIKKY